MSRRERRFTKLLTTADRKKFLDGRGVCFDNSMDMVKSTDPWVPDGADFWDLHAPLIAAIPQSTIRLLRQSSFLSLGERKAFDYLSDTGLYAACHDFTVKHVGSQITPRDMAQLLANDIFELAEEAVGAGYVFCVFEEAKRRRRLVHDALTPNVMCAEPPNPCFNRIERVQHLVHEGEYAASLDLKCCYYQYTLAKAVRKFFAVRNGSKVYQPTRLSMGFKWAVLMANAALKHWCAVVGISTLKSDVYVDNVFVVGKKDVVVPQIERLIDVLEEHGYTVGAVSHGTQVEHRGMTLDMTAKTVQLKQGFVEKVFRRWSSFSFRWSETRSLIGMLVYGLQVLRVPLGTLYHVFKFWARNVATEPATKVPWWEAVRVQLTAAMRLVYANVPVVIPRDLVEPREFIVADACTTTGVIAAILVSGGRAIYFTQQSRFTEIAAMEMEAIDVAVRRWAHKGRAVHLISDSVVTLTALAKGLSANFEVNTQAVSLIIWMRQAMVQPVLWYINTKHNPADPLTRSFQFDKFHQTHIYTMAAFSSDLSLHRGVVRETMFPGSSLPVYRWNCL